MKILVLNSGSSSIKYKLFDMTNKEVLVEGIADRIGEKGSSIKHEVLIPNDSDKVTQLNEFIADHQSGLHLIAGLLFDPEIGILKSPEEIEAVGHRVVHGGEKFVSPTIVNEQILEELKAISDLAPLHNPANLKGIEVAKEAFPDAKQIAVFDTAFHHTMPDYAYRFPIKESFYSEDGLRSYGFHGTSHQYVSMQAASFLNIEQQYFNAISIHLGNGCSISAIENGKSVDTSMGLTPMGGLVMGTRCGDIDPSLILLLGKKYGMSFDQVDRLLNKESGLKGITGVNDFRDITARYEAKEPAAILAVEMYVYRIRKYLGAYAVALGRLDAIIFTAGVGENSSLVREMVCENLDIIGAKIDAQKNNIREKGNRSISSSESKVSILVVPTNEELEIANQAVGLIL